MPKNALKKMPVSVVIYVMCFLFSRGLMVIAVFLCVVGAAAARPRIAREAACGDPRDCGGRHMQPSPRLIHVDHHELELAHHPWVPDQKLADHLWARDHELPSAGAVGWSSNCSCCCSCRLCATFA